MEFNTYNSTTSNIHNSQTSSNKAWKPIEVTQSLPCPHCGKPDWCYAFGNLSVCNRDYPPATGWRETSKTDQDGHFYYAPLDKTNKTLRPKQRRVWEYPDRHGNPLVRVIRIDDGNGGKPKRWQEKWDGHKWVKGIRGIKREHIPIYRYAEVKEAISLGKTIYIVEGETCADALWNLGIPATTNLGGSKKWKPSDSEDLAEAVKVVLCPDRDQPGVEHMEAIAQDFPDAKWLYAFPNSPFWNNLPPNQGLDVADWIEDYQLKANDIKEVISAKRVDLPNPSIPTSAPVIEENYTQKCQAALYPDKHWISFQGKLYFWTGTYYQESPKEEEIQRISNWCNSTPVQSGKKWKYSYATATHVDNIWNWLQRNFSYPPNKVNPPGINCLNGVVKIKWHGRKANYSLEAHHPHVVYTYISEVKFDPHADSINCDRMLSCLEPQEQKLFLQTIAGSLDLVTIRAYQGREASRALLCKGHGNNGKDTLREAVRILFGQTMSNATVNDFAAYDQGRKFCLAKLEGSLINWSSENSSFNNLDCLQSLKAAITGDPLDLEKKGIDERQMLPNSVFLFNVNEVPNLKAGMEAIQSRWAVLSFHKTYKKNADPKKGEIEADSRFRYDPNFLRENVCPALLNKILTELTTLAVDGIDYSCTTEAIADIQRESNHLWAFAQDVGLDYKTNGRVYINDLWELLFRWYIDNGTLEIISENNKEKKIWHEQPRRGDKNVKAPNQIYQRFSELFPKIKKKRDTQSKDRIGQSYLTGLAVGKVVTEATEATEATTEAIAEAVSLIEKQTEATEPINYTPAKILDKTKKLSLEQKRELASMFLSDQELRSLLFPQVSSKNSTTNNLNSENLAEVDPTASVASVPYIDSVIASATASATDSTASVTASPSYVRYQGEIFTVASCDNGLLSLRRSGFRKIVHSNVPLTKCEEIFYNR